MVIRSCEVKDLYSLIEMWGKLSDHHKNLVGYMSPSFRYREIMNRYFREDLANSSVQILVAIEGEEVVGFIRGELKANSRLFDGGMYGYISDIYVEEDFRGLDIADELLRETVYWFKGSGIDIIRLNVNPENYRAIGFYEKFGFEEVNKTFALKIYE